MIGLYESRLLSIELRTRVVTKQTNDGTLVVKKLKSIELCYCTHYVKKGELLQTNHPKGYKH